MLRGSVIRLSYADECRLAKQAQHGDIAARNKMVEANLPLVTMVVTSAFPDASSYTDDLIQEGTFGLIRAVERFKPDLQVRFSTFAAYCIRNFAAHYLHGYARSRPHVSLDAPIPGTEDVPLVECLADARCLESDIARRELSEKVRERLFCTPLSERELRLVEARFSEGRSVSAVGAEWGVTRQSAHVISTRALTKLRSRLRPLKSGLAA